MLRQYSQIHDRMQDLVRSNNKLSAAVRRINTYFPKSASTTTLSRKMNGTAAWTIKDMIALQTGALLFPVNDTILEVQREYEAEWAEAPKRGKNASPAEMQARFSIEAGEAMAALIRARESRDVGDLADAVNQIDDVIAVSTAMRASIIAELAERAKGEA